MKPPQPSPRIFRLSWEVVAMGASVPFFIAFIIVSFVVPHDHLLIYVLGGVGLAIAITVNVVAGIGSRRSKKAAAELEDSAATQSVRSRWADLRKNPWWTIATILLALAAAAIIGENIALVGQRSQFWHSVAFQDIESIATLAAATAAWMSAWVSRRSSRGSTSKESTKGTPDQRMTDTEYKFMHDVMRAFSQNELTLEQAHQLENMLRTLKAPNNDGVSTGTVTVQSAENQADGPAEVNNIRDAPSRSRKSRRPNPN
jgi:hypothetical protein